MLEHFRQFAAYNLWANDILYAAASRLPENELRRDVGIFFHSLFGTLNHILVADQIWMHRFTGEGRSPTDLAAIAHDEMEELHKTRQQMDQRIIEFVGALTDDRLGGIFTYTPVTTPDPVTQPLAEALAHMFNHQTHHRGHAHAALSILGEDPPALDLIYYQRTLR